MVVMSKRVFGAIGIRSAMSVANANWEHQPKQDAVGNYIASPESLKYSIKHNMQLNGRKVLGMRSYYIASKSKKAKKGEEQPTVAVRTLEESIHNKMDEIPKDPSLYIEKLCEFEDVANFGLTHPLNNLNFGLIGVVQVNTGINLRPDTLVVEDQILSPYASESGNGMVTNGVSVKLDEAHFVFPFSINPDNMTSVEGLATVKYTDDNFKCFKDGALKGFTRLNTASKIGTNNEFAIFITLKEGSELDLPIIVSTELSVIKYYEGESSRTFDFTAIEKMYEGKEAEIESFEVYYNPTMCDVVVPKLAETFHILTGRQMPKKTDLVSSK